MRRPRHAGLKSDLVTFRAEVRTDIGGGNFEIEWVDSYSDMPAMVEPLNGMERFQAQQIENKVDYRVFIPYPETSWQPDESMRILWRGLTLGIRAIHWAGPRETFLQIDCEAGVSAEQ